MRTSVCLSIAMLLAGALPAAETAQAKTAHRYTSHITEATLSSANEYPAVGGSAVTAGTVHLTPGGDGALVDRVTITGGSPDSAFTLKGSEVDYLALGTCGTPSPAPPRSQPTGARS